jgi:hypothetical protein
MSARYHEDFYAWSQEQAALLSQGRVAELDTEHLIEELESMGASERRELQSLLRQILVHLLKLDYSPTAHPRAKWTDEISEFRAQVETALDDTPSLRASAGELFGKAWPQARKIAENSLLAHGEKVKLPLDCPYALEQVVSQDFWPMADQAR